MGTKMTKHRCSVFLYVLFILVAFVLPFFSFENYSIAKHTTSHLGAQGSPNAWVMNVVFYMLGAYSVILSYKTKIPYVQVLGMCFGVCLIMTGFYRHAPLITGVLMDIVHDQKHSFFATATGFIFALLSFGCGFICNGRQRIIAFFLGFFSTMTPILMLLKPNYMGIYQRVMFLMAFYWFFFYVKFPKEKKFK